MTYRIDWGECFWYDPETGKLFWKAKIARKIIVGTEAGWICKDSGYRKIKAYGVDYRAHRIVWDLLHPDDLLLEGEEIDHIDHDKLNNRPWNLRKVSGLGNRRNMPKNRNNTSGTTGVTFNTAKNKWVAQIKVNYRKIHLGTFERKDAAVICRKAAEEKYGFHKNHGN